MRNLARIVPAIVCCAALAVTGCGKKASPPAEQAVPSPPAPAAPALMVASVELGNHAGVDKKISSPTAAFAPKDTFFVSVGTEGTAPQALLAVRWLFAADSSTISTTTDTIAPTGPSTTEFHLVSKSGGWPVGKYQVEVMLDGAPAGTQDFEVQKKKK